MNEAELRPYIMPLAERGVEVLRKEHIVYYSIEPRVGKTLICLKTAELFGAKRVLFVTKKKAIASIVGDYQKFPFPFALDVINYESLHKIERGQHDLIVADEAHSLGGFPKPSKCAVQLKKIVEYCPLVMASGTPSPESEVQLCHQFWVSMYNPFNFDNFYKWVRTPHGAEFVNVELKYINNRKINTYKPIRDNFLKLLRKYFVSYTRTMAGFRFAGVEEKIIYVDMAQGISVLIKLLLKNKFYRMKDGSEIVCDTVVKRQSKIHQICSGSVITENDGVRILDRTKAEYIRGHYRGKKIVVFYKYQAEGTMLRDVLPNCTDSPEEFASRDDISFVCQIRSGSMGINLSSADYLIYFNIDFSALQYEQSLARLLDLNRDTPAQVHYIFGRDGIEDKILDAVRNKKDYTAQYFKKDFINGKSSATVNKQTAIRKPSPSEYYQKHQADHGQYCLYPQKHNG